ncbi:MAG: GTP 3',8-cyclase MoaA [Saprospiraceae bacterium]
MTDNFNRKINYLRLAVTDRCNLRCTYCMPEEGLNWLKKDGILSFEEMFRISNLLVNAGVDKIRITGGEPFIRKDIDKFIGKLASIDKLKDIAITTNGTLTAPYISQFKKWKINSCNLSLDALDSDIFFGITKRNDLDKVLDTIDLLLTEGIAIKINCVVMENINTSEIPKMVAMTKDLPISVRFIEEMPFNGDQKSYSGIQWNYTKILDTIKIAYPEIRKSFDPPNSTAYHYQIPGHSGNIGIIAAYSRSFCGTCNRIRLRPDGGFQTCLYGEPVLNVKNMMRAGLTDFEILEFINNTLNYRAKDGWEAEKRNQFNQYSSMATIGG